MPGNDREVRMQYLFPHQLREELERLPLVFLPLATLEWHGPHLVMGVDPINAETVTLALARRIGGVVLPTLYMGTERERPAATLRSLGLPEDAYIVGMDFPTAQGLFPSFYYPEELFALCVRGTVALCIEHGYRYIFIVNGHGAVNHNEVLKRLCAEISHRVPGVKVDFAMSFPRRLVESGAIAHAGAEETSLMMFYRRSWVDMERLPPREEKLTYRQHSIVDGGGFSGAPGPGYAVPDELDPRAVSSEQMGQELFEATLRDLEERIRTSFGIPG